MNIERFSSPENCLRRTLIEFFFDDASVKFYSDNGK